MADDDQVPFQIQSRDPATGEVRTTTGTGRRAIRPPQASAMPDMRQGIIGAYQNLPLGQAEKVINAAMQYQAQRGYQRDIQSGTPAPQALAKWGPMLFRSGVGLPEALKLSAPPQRRVMRGPGGQLFEVPQAGAVRPLTAAPVPKPVAAPKIQNLGPTIQRIQKLESELNDLAKEQGTDVPTGPIADEKRNQANALRNELQQSQRAQPPAQLLQTATAQTQSAPTPKKITTKEQYNALDSGTVYIGKDGNRYRKP